MTEIHTLVKKDNETKIVKQLEVIESTKNDSTRMFKAIAKTYCAVTVLTQADITRLKFMYGDELKSIDEAEEWVQENGVPFMDFRIYRQSRGLMIYKKILKDACRRLVNINRAVDSDVGEIIELLHSISANSFNKTTIPESMQQYVEETCNTMNEFQKRLSNIESKQREQSKHTKQIDKMNKEIKDIKEMVKKILDKVK